jgi:hypothetical protein
MPDQVHLPTPFRGEVPSVKVLEVLLCKNDWSLLSSEGKVEALIALCNAVGINPLLHPFDFLTTKDGRVVPYLLKGGAEQLRNRWGIDVEVETKGPVENPQTGVKDTYEVWVKASSKALGRTDYEVGVVSLYENKKSPDPDRPGKFVFESGPLDGVDLANAKMRAVTKAKRRATLSMVGLGGLMDETELRDMESKGFRHRPEPEVFELIDQTLTNTAPGGSESPTKGCENVEIVEVRP